MQELKCPDCGYLNPDIRELGYALPRSCGACSHVWRLQDIPPIDAAAEMEMIKVIVDEAQAALEAEIEAAGGLEAWRKLPAPGDEKPSEAQRLGGDIWAGLY